MGRPAYARDDRLTPRGTAMGKFVTAAERAPLPIRLPPLAPSHEGKRILVTGAARGLGKAVAALLAAQGANVWLLDVLAGPLAATAEELAIGAQYGVVDISDERATIEAIATARAALGGFDGAVNIAGIVRHAHPLEIARADWERVFAVNVYGSYTVAQQVAQAMIADGVHGAIVNTASEAGKVGHVDSLAYSASKAAVISMTRMLSESLAAHDINVNRVCPGGMPTAMLREVAAVYGGIVGQAPEAVFAELISTQLRRHTSLDEVAQIYSFLLSDAAKVVRGQAINADGGDTPY